MPKVVDADERRQKVVDTTWVLIGDEGWDAVTMRRIAQRLGCTTGRITHWFDSKDDILMAVLDELSNSHQAGLARLRTRVHDAGDDVNQLAIAITETLPIGEQERRDWSVWLAFWSRATSSAQIADHCRALHVEWRSVLESCLSNLSAPSQLDVDKRAEHLLALIDGLGVHMLLEPERYHLDAVQQIVVEYLENA